MDTGKILQKVLLSLKQGKIILYPTDTIWGIGCDATNQEAIKKINALKERKSGQPLLILVSNAEMLKQYVEEVPAFVREQLQTFPRPTTIIYKRAKNLPADLLGDNRSIGIRIIEHTVITKLIEQFGRPLVSTSANKTDKPAPQNFGEIEPSILNNVDYIFPHHDEAYRIAPSDIYEIEGEQLVKIR